MERREIEFKLLLAGPEEAAALRAVLPGDSAAGAPPVAQINHFFDTPERALGAAECALRLRSEDGAWTLTAKGPALEAEAALSRRAEQECSLPGQLAAAVLAGEASALDLLLERGEEPAAPLLVRMRELVGADALTHLGSFENQRTRIGPLQLAGLEHGLVFEFDRTSFGDWRVDWEVEVEVCGSAASAAGQALRELFERARLEWRPATPKAARFFALPPPPG